MSDTDLELLARYSGQNTEDAFAELVRRHIDLVHSAALRQVRSPQLAEEVTQSTFIKLARHAPQLARDTILTAWLYQVTRREAIDVVRREARRQLREQTATEMNAMNATAADWTHIEPLLDEAMHALDDTDRAVVLLRYFENHDLRSIGATLGISDDAAQKRVSRAVDRLREFFAKRGVTVGASGLAVVISANAVQAAPVSLALTISAAAALTGTTLATTATVTATKAIAMTALQKTVITATIAVLAGAGIYEARQAAQLRDQVQTLQQQQAEQIQQSQRERNDATNQLAALRGDIERLNQNSGELLKLRGEAGLFRRVNNDAAKLGDENFKLKLKLADLEGMLRFTTNAPQFKNPFFARDGWVARGTGEPLDTLQTVLSAVKEGDDSKLAQLVSRTDDSQSLDSLLGPKRVWDKVTGIQIVDISVYSTGSSQRTAVIGTILQKQNPPSESPGNPYDNPILEAYRNSEQTMNRWFFVETNGQWLVTGRG